MYVAPQYEASGSAGTDQEELRFARLDTKLDFSQHFHYEVAKLQSLYLTVKYASDLTSSNTALNCSSSAQPTFEIGIYSGRQFWNVRKSLNDVFSLDHQLHVCLLDRSFSGLPHLGTALRKYFSSPCADLMLDQVEQYFKQLAQIINQQPECINCSIVLTFFELDNKGNHLSIGDLKTLNIPAIAAAQVIRRHLAETDNELNLDLGDLISVIAMPESSGLDGGCWWRGKKGLKTGYFPPQCVQIIDDKRSAENAIEFRQFSSGGSDSENYSPSPSPPMEHRRKSLQQVKPVLKHNGKIASCLQVLFRERPTRDRLRHSGIYRLQRVFGTDLAEYAVKSEQSVPIVVRWCCEMIERSGITDGIYRHSGSIHNINQLRAVFEDGKLPNPEDSYSRDPHAVASLLKTFFRELQNPLLTYGLFFHFINAVDTTPNVTNGDLANNDSKSVSNLASLLHSLPPPHHRTLKYLMGHLSRMAAKAHISGMTPKNLSIVFAPNILRAYLMPPKEALTYVTKQARVVELLICNYGRLFENQQPPASQPQSAQQSPSSMHHSQSQNQLLDVQLAQRLYQSQKLVARAPNEPDPQRMSFSVSTPVTFSPTVKKMSSSHDDVKQAADKDENRVHASTASKCRQSLKKFAAMFRDQLPSNSSGSQASTKVKPEIIHCNSRLMNRQSPDSAAIAVTAGRKSSAWRPIPIPRSKSISSPDECLTSSAELNKSFEFVDSPGENLGEVHSSAKWLPALPNSPMWTSNSPLSQASSFTALNRLLMFSETSSPPVSANQSLSKASSKAVLVRGPLMAPQPPNESPVLLSSRAIHRSADELSNNRMIGCSSSDDDQIESLPRHIDGVEHATPVQVVNLDQVKSPVGSSKQLLVVPLKSTPQSENAGENSGLVFGATAMF